MLLAHGASLFGRDLAATLHSLETPLAHLAHHGHGIAVAGLRFFRFRFFLFRFGSRLDAERGLGGHGQFRNFLRVVDLG